MAIGVLKIFLLFSLIPLTLTLETLYSLDSVMILVLVFSLFSLVFSRDTLYAYLLRGREFVGYPEDAERVDGELELRWRSWRLAAETNNLNPWKTVPQGYEDCVKNYVTGRDYVMDLEIVCSEAGAYASSVELRGDGRDVWIFDIDETLLSNLPYYAEHRFGVELFNPTEFDKWVKKGIAPVIEPGLKLYYKIMELGFKVFLLSGRKESRRLVTVENLKNAGFRNWDKLVLRGPPYLEKTTRYKSEKIDEMVEEGYTIWGSISDQWSDLLGSSMSRRLFKFPNPMYYIP